MAKAQGSGRWFTKMGKNVSQITWRRCASQAYIVGRDLRPGKALQPPGEGLFEQRAPLLNPWIRFAFWLRVFTGVDQQHLTHALRALLL